jgi:hypothetical protein
MKGFSKTEIDDEPIAKPAYLSHPGESRGPEDLENTGYRLYEH